MENFVFENRTKIIFGKGTEMEVGAEVKKHADKILLVYGSNSIKKSGLYEKIAKSLKNAGVNFLELGDIQPNPRLSRVYDGIKICRDNGIKFLLAAGGGSAIDTAKAISVGVPFCGDVWDFYTGKAQPTDALGVATILTIPAAGSESSPSSVITRTEGNLKRGLTTELIRPVFSILNPELTYSLPAYQTACGAVDIMAHLMERYFTNTAHVDFTDRLCEATMKTIIKNISIVMKEPQNYDARAEVMWAGCVAHNDLLGTGRCGDWGSHQIEHEISGIYDIAHGAGLAIVFPAWARHVYKRNIPRFAQFATRVWDVEADYSNPEKTVLNGITAMENFFRSIGMPIRLSDMNIDDKRLEEMADKCTGGNSFTAGNFVKLDKYGVLEVLKLSK